MNWEFHASKDGEVWDILDQHVDDDVLSYNQKTILNVSSSLFYSYFRIVNKGYSYYYLNGIERPSKSRSILYIRNVDLQGFVRTKLTCFCKEHSQSTKVFLTIIYVCKSSNE